jgi:hypothetical protein
MSEFVLERFVPAPARRVHSPILRLWPITVFATAIALFGGASRADEPAQVVIRIFSLILLAILLPKAWSRRHAELRVVACLLAAFAAIVIVQLIPLPPQLWRTMPGHDLYAAIADATNVSGYWRPINLTPDQGWDALLSLVVPTVALLVMAVSYDDDQMPIVFAVVAIALASALIGIAQTAQAIGPLPTYRLTMLGHASGLFANRNHQALLLAAALPATAIWATRTEPGMKTQPTSREAAGIAIAITLTVALLSTGSRSGVALLGIGGAAAIFFAWYAVKDRASRWKWAILAAGLVLTTIFLRCGTWPRPSFHLDLALVHSIPSFAGSNLWLHLTIFTSTKRTTISCKSWSRAV